MAKVLKFDLNTFKAWRIVGEGRSSLVVAPPQDEAASLASILQREMGANQTYLHEGRFVFRLRKLVSLEEAPVSPTGVIDAESPRCEHCTAVLSDFIGASTKIELQIPYNDEEMLSSAQVDVAFSGITKAVHILRKCDEFLFVSVLLMPNLVSSLGTGMPCDSRPRHTLTMEIKPKGATLLRGTSDSQHCRFSMMQAVKALRDRDTVFVKSKYCPNALFSLEKERMMCALRALMETPQNNLRMWHSRSEAVVSHDDLLNMQFPLEQFVSVCSSALLDSGVLVKVLQLQALSVGISAQQLVDENDVETCDTDQVFVDQSCLCQTSGGSSETPSEASKVQQLESLRHLTNTDRFYVATTAKDCSILVTLEEGVEHRSLSASMVADEGVLLQVEHANKMFRARVSVVDIDEKKSKSLHHYASHEQKIVDSHRQLLK